MLPTKSNTTSSGCTPTSSECVVWQGPNIPCINLCTGDSISDVTYKIAEKLCAIQGVYDLSPLQLNDLATFCTTIAGPPTGTNKTLLAVLDYIVKKIVCVNAKVDAIVPVTPTPPSNLTLPTCLRYNDGQGNPVTQLSHENFTLTLGTQFCSLKQIVDTHSTTLTNHDYRLKLLEGKGNAVLPQVTPSCSYPGITKDLPVDMDDLLDAVEEDLCNLRRVVGTNTQITAATAQFSTQLCSTISNLNLAQALAKGAGSTMAGAYASLGWNSTVATLSQSIQNLWITVMDMRCLVNELQNCCKQDDCSKFKVDFDVATNTTRSTVTLMFYGNTVIPGTGYVNQSGTNQPKITITDGINTITTPFDLIAVSANQNGLTIQVGDGVNNALNPSSTYTITFSGGISKDGSSCYIPSFIKYSTPPCSNIGGINVTVATTP
jgi:hypothetical protein